MNMTSTSSTQLISRAMGGDQRAFGTLVMQYQGCVSAITLGVTRDLGSSEDVAQDVFLAAWRRRHTLRDPASFPSWIRQIARNKSREHVRALGRRQRRITSDEDVVGRAVASQPDADAVLVHREDLASLQQALDELPDDVRDVLILYYREGQSVRQVAELLGLGEPAVRKRLSRARQRLKQDVLQRISTVLHKTKPGKAFTLGVLYAIAAISPDEAHAAQPSHTQMSRWAVGAGVAALLALSLFGLGSDKDTAVAPSDETKVVGPSHSARSVRAASKVVVPPPDATEAADEEEAQEPERFFLRVGSSGRVQRTFVYEPGFTPESWFPYPDEAPLPDNETSRALQEMLDLRAREPDDMNAQREAALEVVERAHEDGLLPLDTLADADPGTMLVALEAARLQGSDVLEEHDIYQERGQDYVDLAYRLADAEDDALADYGRLYALRTLTESVPAQPAKPPAEFISEALEETRDPRVVAALLTSLPSYMLYHPSGFEPVSEGVLREAAAAIPEADERWTAAITMAEQAFQQEDAESARWWLDLAFDASMSPMKTMPFVTDSIREETPKIAAQMADLTQQEPRNWREALSAALWDCYRVEPTKQTHNTTVRYDGGWQWDEITPDTAFAACMRAWTVQSPAPDPGTLVEMTVQPLNR